MGDFSVHQRRVSDLNTRRKIERHTLCVTYFIFALVVKDLNHVSPLKIVVSFSGKHYMKTIVKVFKDIE